MPGKVSSFCPLLVWQQQLNAWQIFVILIDTSSNQQDLFYETPKWKAQIFFKTSVPFGNSKVVQACFHLASRRSGRESRKLPSESYLGGRGEENWIPTCPLYHDSVLMWLGLIPHTALRSLQIHPDNWLHRHQPQKFVKWTLVHLQKVIQIGLCSSTELSIQ